MLSLETCGRRNHSIFGILTKPQMAKYGFKKRRVSWVKHDKWRDIKKDGWKKISDRNNQKGQRKWKRHIMRGDSLPRTIPKEEWRGKEREEDLLLNWMVKDVYSEWRRGLNNMKNNDIGHKNLSQEAENRKKKIEWRRRQGVSLWETTKQTVGAVGILSDRWRHWDGA